MKKKHDPGKKKLPGEIKHFLNIKKKSAQKLKKGNLTEKSKKRLLRYITNSVRSIQAYYKRKQESQEMVAWEI